MAGDLLHALGHQHGWAGALASSLGQASCAGSFGTSVCVCVFCWELSVGFKGNPKGTQLFGRPLTEPTARTMGKTTRFFKGKSNEVELTCGTHVCAVRPCFFLAPPRGLLSPVARTDLWGDVYWRPGLEKVSESPNGTFATDSWTQGRIPLKQCDFFVLQFGQGRWHNRLPMLVFIFTSAY